MLARTAAIRVASALMAATRRTRPSLSRNLRRNTTNLTTHLPICQPGSRSNCWLHQRDSCRGRATALRHLAREMGEDSQGLRRYLDRMVGAAEESHSNNGLLLLTKFGMIILKITPRRLRGWHLSSLRQPCVATISHRQRSQRGSATRRILIRQRPRSLQPAICSLPSTRQP